MLNLEIAKIFYEMADILEMQGVEWKPRAYRRAAKSIASLSEDVEDIYKKDSIKALEEIPGIGERLAKKIIEFIRTGKIKEHERLKKLVPRGLDQLMEIPGMGPKKAEFLYKKLKIATVKELEKAVKKHKLRNLEGFDAKTEENILKGIEIFKKGKERMLLGFALPIAQAIEKQLKNLKEVDKIAVAGSLRRMLETIGDIDILITSKKPKKVMDFFTSMPDVARVLAKGSTKSTIVLKDGLQVDLRVVNPDCFGSALQYFTGSKYHSIKLRELAIKKGYRLSEYGLFDKKTNKKTAGRTEKEVYNKLGLPYIEPELRENRGEIQAAINKKLPKSIEYNEIKGDVHVHSRYSDGADTIEEIAKAAKSRNYKWICITDHSKTRVVARGLNEDRLLNQIKEIKKLNKKLKNFRIFSGTEVDIMADGSLDYEDGVLKKLDIVVAAIHSGFKGSKEKITKRIINAMENKYVRIIAHPTGRLINRREPYAIDLPQIFDIAKEKNVFLEVNASPDRLDLKDINIKTAVEQGLKLAIGTDSHSINHLKHMDLGVAQARRGWATKKDIINCLSLNDVSKIFKVKGD